MAMGAGAHGAAHRVRPVPGHHRLHRGHRRGHRHPAAQGLPRARRVDGHARALRRAGAGPAPRALPTLRWPDAGDRRPDAGHPARSGRASPSAIPAPLVALAVAALVAAVLAARFIPGFRSPPSGAASRTIRGGTLPGIPRLPPLPGLPWTLPGADGRPLDLSLGLIRELSARRRSPSPCSAPSSRCSRPWSPTA